MNCLPCFNKDDDDEATAPPPPPKKDTSTQTDAISKEAAVSSSKAQTFNFRELAMATKNFRQECLLGEGGFGRVFKGKLHSTGKVVAVKQLDRNGMQGNKEFLVEVLMLSLIQHTNLVNLIGYCADGDQRLLVYEYLPMGSLENQLFGEDPEKKPMDWYTRMKIAAGAANGLEYLHDKANPPIIYRDLKPSNILLDENYEPKLSDFGLAKLGAGGGKINPTSRVMGTYGYSAPEYSSGGELTLKSDIYSFGVVLLELLTGRKSIDTTRPNDEQNLVTWAQPIFREPKKFPELADPKLKSEFPVTSLNQAVGICAMCLQEEPSVRPLISDVVAALSFLAIPQPISASTSASTPSSTTHSPPSEQKMQYETEIISSEAPQSEQGSSHYDDRSSGDGESSESEDESVSDQPNEGSSSHGVAGETNGSSQYSGVESERQDSDRRQSSDNSEERSSYTSDSDSGGEDTNYEDAETRELDERSADSIANESLYSAKSNDSSMKSDAGNKSSEHGSSRRSSPRKDAGSRRRKPVVTFKEPSLSAKKNGTIKPKEESSSSDNNNHNIDSNNKDSNNQTVIPAATDTRQQQSSSSSSSESSSDSEDEKGNVMHENETRDAPQKNEDHQEGISSNTRNEISHRVFDQPKKDGPVLRHLKTR